MKLSSPADAALPSTPGTSRTRGLDDDEGGQLAAGEHEVADRQLAVDEVVGDPLVDALVAAAEEREGHGPERRAGPARPASSAATA